MIAPDCWCDTAAGAVAAGWALWPLTTGGRGSTGAGYWLGAVVWQAASIAVNARPISLNMSFISTLAPNLEINAAIRRQACDQIVAVLLIAHDPSPALPVTLPPYSRRKIGRGA